MRQWCLLRLWEEIDIVIEEEVGAQQHPRAGKHQMWTDELWQAIRPTQGSTTIGDETQIVEVKYNRET
jgi:hypothetical protein